MDVGQDLRHNLPGKGPVQQVVLKGGCVEGNGNRNGNGNAGSIYASSMIKWRCNFQHLKASYRQNKVTGHCFVTSL